MGASRQLRSQKEEQLEGSFCSSALIFGLQRRNFQSPSRDGQSGTAHPPWCDIRANRSETAQARTEGHLLERHDKFPAKLRSCNLSWSCFMLHQSPFSALVPGRGFKSKHSFAFWPLSEAHGTWKSRTMPPRRRHDMHESTAPNSTSMRGFFTPSFSATVSDLSFHCRPNPDC